MQVVCHSEFKFYATVWHKVCNNNASVVPMVMVWLLHYYASIVPGDSMQVSCHKIVVQTKSFFGRIGA